MSLKNYVVFISAMLIGLSNVNAEDIAIKKGWQNIGALQELDLSVFENTCVKYIWRYDNQDENSPEWKLYIANAMSYTYSGGFISSVEKGAGIWVLADSACSVSTDVVCQNINPITGACED